jgi:signal transduction histidine kinase
LSRQWIGLVASYALIIGSAATYFTPLIYSADHSIWLNRNKPNYSFDGWFYTGRFLESFSVLTILLLFALFPNGRFVPRWIRWPLILFIAVRLYYLIYTDLLDWGEWVQWTISLTDWVCVLSVIVAQIYRYRRVSTPVERQQTKWLVFSGVAWWLVRYSSGLPSDSGFNINLSDTLYWPLSRLINYSFSFFLVASFILALFRQRLWGIDLVINRTLVYGTLTLTVILLYLSLVLGLNTLFQQTIQGNLLISMLATVVIALLFQPLRHKLQRAVNRYMYGERDDPYGVLARLGQRLEGTLAPEQVLPTIVETVAQTLKLPYAAIELAYSSTSTLVLAETSGETSKPGEVAATYGTPGPTSSLTRFPLSYQSETVGYLVLRARAGEKLGRSDQRLLKDLTHQVGIAVSAVKLTLDLKRLAQDLQQARELLVTTREEERRRLRRDLHDGLGPTLASLSFKMEAARNLLGPGNERVDALLSNISQQTQQTITEIRQLVYSLRPPALDELGLILAIKEQAAQQQLPTLRIGVEAPESLPELSAAVEVAAYRIVQEAITNVVRHAKATKCVIRIETRNQTLLIEVMDDGQGISPAHRSGVGLRAMYERASELGGSCTIQPGQDRGTVVQVKLHLPTLKVRAALVQEVLN